MAPVARASSGWVSPSTLFVTGADDPARTAMDSSGDTVAVWAQSDGSNTRVESAYRPAGGTFSAPVTVSAAGENASCPALATDSSGNVTVAWLRSDGANEIVQASYGQLGGSLSSPANISASGVNAGCPQVVTSAGGAVTVAFTSGSAPVVMQAVSRAPGQAFGPPVAACDSTESVQTFALAGGPGAHASVLCAEQAQNSGSNEIVEGVIGSNADSTLATSSDLLLFTALAINARGDAVAAWRTFHDASPSAETVQAASNPGGQSAWGSAVTIDNGANAPGIFGLSQWLEWGPPVASIDPNGNSIVAWYSAAGLIQSIYQPYGQSFGAGTTVSLLSESAGPPVIATNAHGDTVVAWSQSNGQDNRPEASVAGPGEPLAQGVPMSASGAVPSSAAVDPSGNAVVAWSKPDGAGFDTGVTGFEATPPQVGSLSVPTTGGAGTELTVSATTSSIWSPLTTTWSWGDNTPDTTAAVARHAYAAAGTYRITLTVADEVGNVASESRSITITRAPAGLQLTPKPKKGVKAQFVLAWHWLNSWTVLRSISIRHVPRQARIALSCTGRSCPRLKPSSVTAKHLKRLLATLKGARFRAGDMVRITITAPHMTTERIQLTIRYNREPKARLLKP